MSVKIEKFGELPDGRTASLYHLKNHRGFEVCVTDFGVNIQSILVRNCRGEKTDVALDLITWKIIWKTTACLALR